MQGNPEVRSYRTKAFPNFNDLYLIYGYTTADGRYSRSSHDVDFDDDIQGWCLAFLLHIFGQFLKHFLAQFLLFVLDNLHYLSIYFLTYLLTFG